MFSCMECGKKFLTVKAAERAADRGCPKCGGVDIDLTPVNKPKPAGPIVGVDPATRYGTPAWGASDDNR